MGNKCLDGEREETNVKWTLCKAPELEEGQMGPKVTLPPTPHGQNLLALQGSGTVLFPPGFPNYSSPYESPL